MAVLITLGNRDLYSLPPNVTLRISSASDYLSPAMDRLRRIYCQSMSDDEVPDSPPSRSRSQTRAQDGVDTVQDYGDEKDFEPPERLVPYRWVLWGLGASIVFGTVLVWVVFGAEGIRPWATVIGFLMGGLLSLLG